MLLIALVKRVWAAPYTLIGMAVGCAGLLTGGGAQVRRGVIEFHGGLVRWLLGRMPGIGGALAMTLGHTILGQTAAALDATRDHEHVHVRQFERWGPLMGPAYLGCSLWLLATGAERPYRDNPFEREAFEADARRGGATD